MHLNRVGCARFTGLKTLVLTMVSPKMIERELGGGGGRMKTEDGA